MDAEQTLAALEQRGVEVSLEEGRLRLSRHPEDLAEDVRANREAIVAALLGRAWQVHLDSLPLRTDDPRPDLAADSELWTRLLNLTHGMAGRELREVLHGLRCLGARLVWAGRMLRLVPGEEMSAEEYAADRERWLMPHAQVLSETLASLARAERA